MILNNPSNRISSIIQVIPKLQFILSSALQPSQPPHLPLTTRHYNTTRPRLNSRDRSQQPDNNRPSKPHFGHSFNRRGKTNDKLRRYPRDENSISGSASVHKIVERFERFRKDENVGGLESRGHGSGTSNQRDMGRPSSSKRLINLLPPTSTSNRSSRPFDRGDPYPGTRPRARPGIGGQPDHSRSNSPFDRSDRSTSRPNSLSYPSIKPRLRLDDGAIPARLRLRSTPASSQHHSQSSNSFPPNLRSPQHPPPTIPQDFTSFPLNSTLISSLNNLIGQSNTLPIQTISLSHLIKNPTNSLIGAETGSGKTLAFLLPLLHHLKLTDPRDSTNNINISHTDDSKGYHQDKGQEGENNTVVGGGVLLPRSIVISPTHELNRQSTSVTKSLIHGIKLSVVGLSNTRSGGIGEKKGIVDVLFGTLKSVLREFKGNLDGEEVTKGGIEVDNEADEGEEGEEGKQGLWTSRKKKEEEDNVDDGRCNLGMGKIEWVVIDEADVLLGPSFIEETSTFLSLLPKSTKIILVTATLPPSLLSSLTSIPELSQRRFTALLSPNIHKLPTKLKTVFIPRPPGSLGAEVVKVVNDELSKQQGLPTQSQSQGKGGETGKGRVVVFCNSDNRIKEISSKFEEKEKNLKVLVWGSMSKERRRGTQGGLSSFLSSPSPSSSEDDDYNGGKEASVLITTSLLSRGLDFNISVKTVILVDPPRDELDFIHRAGRTGRAGRSGKVIVIGGDVGRMKAYGQRK